MTILGNGTLELIMGEKLLTTLGNNTLKLIVSKQLMTTLGNDTLKVILSKSNKDNVPLIFLTCSNLWTCHVVPSRHPLVQTPATHIALLAAAGPSAGSCASFL